MHFWEHGVGWALDVYYSRLGKDTTPLTLMMDRHDRLGVGRSVNQTYVCTLYTYILEVEFCIVEMLGLNWVLWLPICVGRPVFPFLFSFA